MASLRKNPRCPACGKALTNTCRYGNAPDDEPWHECVTEDCDLMGMEGFLWHWKAVRKAKWKEADDA